MRVPKENVTATERVRAMDQHLLDRIKGVVDDIDFIKDKTSEQVLDENPEIGTSLKKRLKGLSTEETEKIDDALIYLLECADLYWWDKWQALQILANMINMKSALIAQKQIDHDNKLLQSVASKKI